MSPTAQSAPSATDEEIARTIHAAVSDVLGTQVRIGHSTHTKRMSYAIHRALTAKYRVARGAGELPGRAKRKIARAVRRNRGWGEQRLPKESIRWITKIVIERLEQYYVATPR